MRLCTWPPAPRPGEQPVERLPTASLAHGGLEKMPRVHWGDGLVPYGEVRPVQSIYTNCSQQAQLVVRTRCGRGFQPVDPWTPRKFARRACAGGGSRARVSSHQRWYKLQCA